MIEGLKLTMPGEDIRRLLKERAQEHRDRADRWTRERARTKEDETEDEPLLPDHMCVNEADEHEWRAEVLDFVAERIEHGEIYRLTRADLEWGELLPEKPGWMEQQEFEERTAVGFQLERIAKEMGRRTPVELSQ
jgi:hypothetical protein